MRTRRIVAATFLIWLLAAYAQQPAPRAPVVQQENAPLQKPQYKFQAESQLVVLNVSAKDKSGKPIENLKAGDFTVTEDGKPQVVKIFEYQRLEEDALPAEPPPPPEPKNKPAEKAPPTVAPAVQTAITPARPGEIKYKDKRLLVLYLDFQGMPADDQIRVQDNALKFLRTQMTPSDLVALMTYAGELKVLDDFTEDRDSVEADIKKQVIGQASEMGDVEQDDSSEDTGAAYVADDTEFNIFNTDRQLSALEDAVRMLATLPEKKALVYFGSGVTRNGIDNDAQLRATINAALKSNVSFYPVDARGLVASSPVGNASVGAAGGNNAGVGGGSRGSGGNFSGSAASSRQSSFQATQDTLYALANDTGGKLFVDSNDLSAGIVQAQKDISSYYILGYYTTNPALDGKFRRIKVSLNNGVQVARLDYRQGYFADKQFKKFDSSDRERQLQEALMLGDPLTDLSLALETDYFRMARDRYYVPVSVKMPGTDLELAKHGNAETTRLDFIGEIRDSKNQIAASARDFITVTLKGETAAQLAKRTVAYDVGFVLGPGAYTVKFLARENETGKMGTFEAKFTVPDLSVDQKYIPISSVILSNQQEKTAAQVGGARMNARLFTFNPLIQNGEKLIPSVTRVFRKDQQMYVFLQAYEPAATTTEPLIANLSFYRGKVKAFESQPVEIKEGLNPNTKAVPIRFVIPLSKLEPGRYTCQVSVLEPAVQRFAFWRAPVTLLP
jgi:VWFA-related protein